MNKYMFLVHKHCEVLVMGSKRKIFTFKELAHTISRKIIINQWSQNNMIKFTTLLSPKPGTDLAGLAEKTRMLQARYFFSITWIVQFAFSFSF